jgi:hypothetical protein
MPPDNRAVRAYSSSRNPSFLGHRSEAKPCSSIAEAFNTVKTTLSEMAVHSHKTRLKRFDIVTATHYCIKSLFLLQVVRSRC